MSANTLQESKQMALMARAWMHYHKRTTEKQNAVLDHCFSFLQMSYHATAVISYAPCPSRPGQVVINVLPTSVAMPLESKQEHVPRAREYCIELKTVDIITIPEARCQHTVAEKY